MNFNDSLCPRKSKSKPAAFVSYPPADEQNGNRSDQSPHQWQSEICDKAENDKDHPKDLLFHLNSVSGP